MKVVFLFPLFSGLMSAAVICSFIILFGGQLHSPAPSFASAVEEIISGVEALPPEDQEGLVSLESALAEFEDFSLSLLDIPAKQDAVLESYRDLGSQPAVVDFFSTLVQSQEIAAAVLANASEFNISPGLAFALCWEESQYHIRAVSKVNNNKSIDRGLFQLNSLSFPKLTEADFFNPVTNAHYAMSHLRLCLDAGGSEISALAMYNAGANRVDSGGTPKKTLDYISRILESQRKIEELFRLYEEHNRQIAAQSVIVEEDEEPKGPGLRLSLLMPSGHF